MKTILTYTLLAMLMLGLGCKRSPVGETVDPNPPQPPSNCRIIKTTYKTPTLTRETKLISEPETITLDNKEKIQVSTVIKTTYKYDAQNRIIESRRENTLTYYLERFTYTDDYLIQYTEFTAVGTLAPTVILDTIQLNKQGLVSRYNDLGEPFLLYNTDKQPIGNLYYPAKTHMYENGNLIQVMDNAFWIERDGQFVPIDYRLKRYNYAVDRPNIPVIYQFRGQSSRSLPLKEVWEKYQSSQFPDGPVYQKTYTYSYDKLGRVKRRVAHGIPIRRGWMTEDDLYGVGVTDYEYECD